VSTRFGNPEVTLTENGNFPLNLTNTKNSGFWIKFLPCRSYNMNLSFYYSLSSDDNNRARLKVEIDAIEDGHVRLLEVSGGAESVLTEFSKKFVAKNQYMIWILRINDRLLISVGRKIYVNFDISRYSLTGDIEVPKPSVGDSNRLRLKFARFAKDEIDIITSNLVSKRVFKTIIWPIGSLSGQKVDAPDDDSGEKPPGYLNLVYVSRNNICKRAIALPVNAKLSYKIKAPENGTFSFEYSRLQYKNMSSIPLSILLSIENVNGDNIYKKTYSLAQYQGWRRPTFDLAKFAGEEILIKFSVTSPEGYQARDEDIIFLGNPVLRTPRSEDDKNILLISLDTLRPDHLGCYGYRRDTSANIDRLAAEAVVFENAFSHCPWTLPSHSTMLSSFYPLETGSVLGKDHVQLTFSRLAPSIKTLAEYLKDSGYSTFAVTGGGWISPTLGFSQGFESFRRIREKRGEDIKNIISTTIKQIEDNKNRKWFGFIHSYEIHEPYIRSYYKPDPADGKAAEAISNYDSGIRYADDALGELIKFLKSSGLYDDTIIIITSDHGESFYNRENGLPEHARHGLHGHNLYDELLRVPLIIGGGIDKEWRGKRVGGMSRLADILPTVLDITGAEAASGIRGLSLIPLIEGDGRRERVVYSEAVKKEPKYEMKSLRSSKFKLMKRLFADDQSDSFLLYDLVKDRHESLNIAAKNQKIVWQYDTRINEIKKSMLENIKRLLKNRGEAQDQKEIAEELSKFGYLGK
jgi:arylsulfatase A-like enzyme